MAAGMDGFRLSQYKWEDGGNLEELITWGITPAIALVDILDRMEDNKNLSDNPVTCLILNDLKCKLEDIEKTIYRFMDEMNEEKKAPETAQPSTDSEA